MKLIRKRCELENALLTSYEADKKIYNSFWNAAGLQEPHILTGHLQLAPEVYTDDIFSSL